MSCDPWRSILRLALALAVLAAAPAGAADITWPAALYNPDPAPDDLILPMPCGGAMAFRPVLVPADPPLGDRQMTLGGSDERFDYAEAYRRRYLAGSFSAGRSAGGQLYYIGKYEVTTAQYDAVAVKPCGKPGPTGGLPKASLAWSEAITFAEGYTEWLYANAPAKLPQEDGVRGFLRLPTEDEWEYAARGGAAVSESEFLKPLFPMTGPLAEYAWYGAPETGFKAKPIGLLKPNPLGLYDVLGNVGEMVLDPFRLNKISRLQGRAGGVTVKGGDYLTPPDAIRTAERQEINPYDHDGLHRMPTVGFRLVITLPVLTSPDRLEAIRRAWRSLPRTDSVLAGTQRLEDPVDEVNLLIKATDDPALKERLAGLRSVIEQNIATRNEQRDIAARSMLRFGGFLALRIDDAHRLREARQVAYDSLAQAFGKDSQQAQEQKGFMDQAQEVLDSDIKYYADILGEVAQYYPDAVVARQGEVLGRELEAQKLTRFARFVAVFQRHLATFREKGDVPTGTILNDLQSSR